MFSWRSERGFGHFGKGIDHFGGNILVFDGIVNTHATTARPRTRRRRGDPLRRLRHPLPQHRPELLSDERRHARRLRRPPRARPPAPPPPPPMSATRPRRPAMKLIPATPPAKTSSSGRPIGMSGKRGAAYSGGAPHFARQQNSPFSNFHSQFVLTLMREICHNISVIWRGLPRRTARLAIGTVVCPNCGGRFSADSGMSRRNVRCPHCGESIFLKGVDVKPSEESPPPRFIDKYSISSTSNS